MLGLKTYQLLVLLFIVSLITQIIIAFIIDFFLDVSFSSSNEIGSESKRSLSYFFYGVILAPVLETAVFQKMALGFFRVFIKNNLVCIIIAAVIFGLIHYNGVAKIIVISSGGFFLGLFYTILKRKRLNAFWLTALFHAFWNLFVFTIHFFHL